MDNWCGYLRELEVTVLHKDLQALWKEIIDKAIPHLPEGSAELWFNTCTPVRLEREELVVEVANVFAKEQLASRFLPELNRAAQSTGKVSSIGLLTVENPEEKKDPWIDRAKDAVVKPSPRNYLNLNPNYEFSSFVVGKSNRLAHAASLAVAETPGKAYNPLFIWGGVGLGKTHLMHAICHYILDKKNNLKVIYVSSEKFINEFIQAIRTHQGDQFKEKYRGVDILLIDDIQFLGDKQASQEEFFHTFDSLREIDKQVVICSDRPPAELKNVVEERLVSRFTWGLVTDIQPPDIETRIAILQKKALLRNYRMPEEIINFLAQRIPSNIRELEGALNRLIACSELSSEPPTIDNATVWLKDILIMSTKGPTTISNIQNIVAESFEMSVDDLMSSKRTADIAMARQMAMYICRECTGASLKQIGDAFKRKDHTTVIHAYKKITQLIKIDPQIREFVDSIRAKL